MNIYLDGIIYSLQKSGGVTRYTNEIAKKISSTGNKVTFFMHPSQLNQQPQHEDISNIYIKTPLKTKSTIAKYLTYPIDKALTELYFRKNPPQNGVFHSSFFSHYKNLKIPQIVTVHDMTNEKFSSHFNWIKNKIFLIQKKRAIVSANALICVSQQTSNDLIELYGINPEKINVIHLGVDKAFMQKGDASKKIFLSTKNINKPYFLFVGKRSLYKNFHKLIEAYKDWGKKNSFDIITIGGGELTRSEIESISKFGLVDNIKNFDFVSEDDLVMFYNCAQAFIFPSLYEGFGLPIMESLACGTLVLAADIPVFREIGKDVPIYFDPQDSNSIIEALDISLKDNLENKIEGIKIAQTMTWEETASKTLEVYRKYNMN